MTVHEFFTNSRMGDSYSSIRGFIRGWFMFSTKRSNPERGQVDTSPLEREIDQLVYQLYGLTEDEVRIVEGRE
jgi:hypothetical protein